MSTTNQESREIDLLELFNQIGKGIKNAFLGIIKAIVFLIAFGLKRAHYLLLIAAVGGLIGYILSLVSGPTYSTGMIITPNGIPSTEVIDYVEDLTNICKEKNYQALAMAMEIPDSLARKIRKIEAYPYIDLNLDGRGDIIDFDGVYNPKDTTQQLIMNRLYIKAELIENQPRQYFQNGLINYINKNDYMVQLNSLRKAELSESIIQTEIEIQKLDSLQNKEYFDEDNSRPVPVQSGGYILYTQKDKPLYYQYKLSLLQTKQELQKELELIQGPITIIKDFSEVAEEKISLFKKIILFGFWFGVVGYLILLFITYYKKIVSYL